jgi:hypothetical protein
MKARDFFRQTRINTVIAYVLTSAVFLAFLASILQYRILWTIFTAVTLTAILTPPISNRDHRLMLPWEILFLAVIPITVRILPLSLLSTQLATYLSVAALALIIIVELHIFTYLKLNRPFAAILVLISTLALGGAWSLLQFWLGEFTGQPRLTDNTILMYDYINVTLAGLIAGISFNLYFKRRDENYQEELEEAEK